MAQDHLPLLTFSARKSSRSAKWARRCKTIPALFAAFVTVWSLLPILLVLALLFDLLKRRPLPNVRLLLFGAWWLAMEVLGVTVAFFFWLVFAPFKRLNSPTSQRWHSLLQSLWSRGLALGGKYTLRLRWQVDGLECLLESGPLIVLARHGSQGDALLTAALLSAGGRRLRFILKQQLLGDPCLDIVGHRIPNYFVDRDSLNNKNELANIGQLATGLASDEALVIFPEGTRFSNEKLSRAVTALCKTAPTRVQAARALTSVLPIRTAGTLAALARSSADVVILNHVGIRDISSLKELQASVPLPTTLKFHLWRTPRDELPAEWAEEQLVEWLDAQWASVNSWVADNQHPVSPETRH